MAFSFPEKVARPPKSTWPDRMPCSKSIATINDGCRYFVMRRSLRRLDDGDHFVLREPLEDELHKEKCLALADLQFADTQAKAENALRRLGASSPLSADPEKPPFNRD